MNHLSYGLKEGLYGLGISLAIASVACTFLFTHALKGLKSTPGSISVKGKAERLIMSDFVKWQGSISTSAETLIKAYELLEKDMATLTQYLKKAGVPDREIAFSSVYISTIYKKNEDGNSTNDIEGYTLTQEFTVSSTAIDRVAKLSQSTTSLIKEGLKISSFQPQYFYTKLESLKIEMLGEAAKDAFLRAEELVKASGSSVGRLKSAQQGVFQITSAHSTSFSDYGEYDTSSIEKAIKAVVTMDYMIE